MDVEILGDITVVETIARGRGIRDLKRLRKSYGKGQWRKVKELPAFVFRAAASASPSFTGTRRTRSVRGKSSANATWTDSHEKTEISLGALRGVH
jgi:hypothetical protein